MRPVKDRTTGNLLYGLIKGLQRYTAASDIGMQAIPANVIELSDVQVQNFQIMLGKTVKDIRPVQFSKGLQRILQYDDLMSMSHLCSTLHVDEEWVNERLGLENLSPPAQRYVTLDKINVCNAYVLARLPVQEQGRFINKAMTMDGANFSSVVFRRIKELREVRRAKVRQRA